MQILNLIILFVSIATAVNIEEGMCFSLKLKILFHEEKVNVFNFFVSLNLKLKDSTTQSTSSIIHPLIESTSTQRLTTLVDSNTQDLVLFEPRETLICENINCKDARFTSFSNDYMKCPEDSYEIETSPFEEQCCGVKYTCECVECNISTMELEKCSLLGDLFEIVIVKEGDRTPGNCCDSLICSSKNYSCEHQGAFYYHNQKWQEDECTHCFCELGIVKCVNNRECPNEQCDVKIIENCCQVCTGECISSYGMYRQNNETWTESDDCIKCTCINGTKECLSELCEHPKCKNPIKIEGECCLKCPNDNSILIQPLKFPPHCNLIKFKCNLTCSNGLKLDNNRCPLCECSKFEVKSCEFSCENQDLKYYPLNDRICKCTSYCQKRQKCSISCPNGYAKDLNGCDKCECESNGYTSNLVDCFYLNNQEYCPLIEYSNSLNNNFTKSKSNICKAAITQTPIIIKLDKCTKCLCKEESIYCETHQFSQQYLCENLISNENCCSKCSNENEIKSLTKEDATTSSSLSLNLWSCIDIDNQSLRSHATIWKHNDCLHCKCNNGYRECFKQTCKRNNTNCKNLFIMRNTCCPVCLDNITYVESLCTISSNFTSSN
jgi:hypothetical protein